VKGEGQGHRKNSLYTWLKKEGERPQDQRSGHLSTKENRDSEAPGGGEFEVTEVCQKESFPPKKEISSTSLKGSVVGPNQHSRGGNNSPERIHPPSTIRRDRGLSWHDIDCHPLRKDKGGSPNLKRLTEVAGEEGDERRSEIEDRNNNLPNVCPWEGGQGNRTRNPR